MAYPPPTLPTNRTNATPQQDTHPGDHNQIAAAINDIVTQLNYTGGLAENNRARLDQAETNIVNLFNGLAATNNRMTAVEAALHSSGMLATATGQEFGVGAVAALAFDSRLNNSWGADWGQFICPVGGSYVCSVYVHGAQPAPVNSAHGLFLYVRGAISHVGWAVENQYDMSCAAALQLGAGDQIVVNVYNSTGAQYMNGTFAIFKIPGM